MSKRRALLLLVVTSALVESALTRHPIRAEAAPKRERVTTTSTPFPTVTIFQSTPVAVPTVVIPQATPTTTPKPVHHSVRVRHHRRHAKKLTRRLAPARHYTWIWAYLTSYCPGSAGWIASSGARVFYGMLANDYYAFGTQVYMPVVGITGVVEDRQGDGSSNHFDVWSPVCYSTPTGWFKVAVVG